MKKTIWWLCLLYMFGIITSMTGCDMYEEKGLCSYLFGCGDDGGDDDDGDQSTPSPRKNKTIGE